MPLAVVAATVEGVQVRESEVTAEGETTLPKPVLEALALESGGRVRYFVGHGTVFPRAAGPVDRLAGMLPYDGPPVTVEGMDQAIADGAADLGADCEPTSGRATCEPPPSARPRGGRAGGCGGGTWGSRRRRGGA